MINDLAEVAVLWRVRIPDHLLAPAFGVRIRPTVPPVFHFKVPVRPEGIKALLLTPVIDPSPPGTRGVLVSMMKLFKQAPAKGEL